MNLVSKLKTRLYPLSSILQPMWPVSSGCPACVQLQWAAGFHGSSPLSAGKRKNTKKKLVKPVTFSKSHKSLTANWKVIGIWPKMTVQDIADAMDRDIDHVFEVLMYIPGTSQYDSPDAEISDLDLLKEILTKSGFRWNLVSQKKQTVKVDKDAYKRPPPAPSELVERPPVVTIMGHVDHGKTTLLDALRQSNIVAKEFGGITQHIGAFSVTLPSGEAITFLDTPGHAAFSAMRARGAQVTDIVVLVVAADDGIMKQTVESMRFAQEANVPILVAINKIDKSEADIDFAKQELLQHGITLEEHGGDTQAVPISALKGTNLAALQEAIVTQAELMELMADPHGLVEGVVIEAKTDPGRGKLATVLIQRGTLKKGCSIVAGPSWAKVRNMYDDQGRVVTTATPGTAVEVIGWKDLPSAGDEVLQVDTEQRAKEVVAWRQNLAMEQKSVEDQAIVLQKMAAHQERYKELRSENLKRGIRKFRIFGAEKTKEVIVTHTGPELAVIIKADVDGSMEAILDVLATYDSRQCRLHLLHYGVGPISEYDVEVAASFSGRIYAFNTPCPAKVSQMAKDKNVGVHDHNVIYQMVDDMKEELTSVLPPVEEETILGEAVVLQPFTVTEGKKKVPVAGSRCLKGTLNKQKRFKLLRNEQILIDGELDSLKHFKKEVGSIQTNSECGISFEDKTVEPEVGDTIICYEMEEVPQTLNWHLDF